MAATILVGEGKRLFRDADAVMRLRLNEAAPTSTGILLLAYVPDPAST